MPFPWWIVEHYATMATENYVETFLLSEDLEFPAAAPSGRLCTQPIYFQVSQSMDDARTGYHPNTTETHTFLIS